MTLETLLPALKNNFKGQGEKNNAQASKKMTKSKPTKKSRPKIKSVFKTVMIGNQEYKTVVIGNQEWMAENLDTDHFRNGDPIPEVTSENKWKKSHKKKRPACCYFGNEPKIGKEYGRLYNWYAVTDKRNIAPMGWHVPTNDEWETLVDYLGGADVAGGKIKETGIAHWRSPNNGATNKSGFSALPGESRDLYGHFFMGGKLGYDAFFWSATDYDKDCAWNRVLNFNHLKVEQDQMMKGNGFSVRLVKDSTI